MNQAKLTAVLLLNAFHWRGSMELARTLIASKQEPARLVLREAPGGETSLHVACQQGHQEIAKALIKAGGEELLLKSTNDGFSCLDIACQNEHLELMKALIKAGGEALLLKTTEDGSSCLCIPR